MISFFEGSLPTMAVFHQRSSSIKGCIHERLSFIEGCLPSNVVIHRSSSLTDTLFPTIQNSIYQTRQIWWGQNAIALLFFFLSQIVLTLLLRCIGCCCCCCCCCVVLLLIVVLDGLHHLSNIRLVRKWGWCWWLGGGVNSYSCQTHQQLS